MGKFGQETSITIWAINHAVIYLVKIRVTKKWLAIRKGGSKFSRKPNNKH